MRKPHIPPWVHKLATKGEHAFHASYLAVEAAAGHPPLSMLAAGILVCIIAHAAYDFLS